MIFKILTIQASEYTEWMYENGVKQIIWNAEDCPIADVHHVCSETTKRIVLENVGDNKDFVPDGMSVRLSIYGTDFVLYSLSKNN